MEMVLYVSKTWKSSSRSHTLWMLSSYSWKYSTVTTVPLRSRSLGFKHWTAVCIHYKPLNPCLDLFHIHLIILNYNIEQIPTWHIVANSMFCSYICCLHYLKFWIMKSSQLLQVPQKIYETLECMYDQSLDVAFYSVPPSDDCVAKWKN